jgi:hypothetical protein
MIFFINESKVSQKFKLNSIIIVLFYFEIIVTEVFSSAYVTLCFDTMTQISFTGKLQDKFDIGGNMLFSMDYDIPGGLEKYYDFEGNRKKDTLGNLIEIPDTEGSLYRRDSIMQVKYGSRYRTVVLSDVHALERFSGPSVVFLFDRYYGDIISTNKLPDTASDFLKGIGIEGLKECFNQFKANMPAKRTENSFLRSILFSNAVTDPKFGRDITQVDWDNVYNRYNGKLVDYEFESPIGWEVKKFDPVKNKYVKTGQTNTKDLMDTIKAHNNFNSDISSSFPHNIDNFVGKTCSIQPALDNDLNAKHSLDADIHRYHNGRALLSDPKTYSDVSSSIVSKREFDLNPNSFLSDTHTTFTKKIKDSVVRSFINNKFTNIVRADKNLPVDRITHTPDTMFSGFNNDAALPSKDWKCLQGVDSLTKETSSNSAAARKHFQTSSNLWAEAGILFTDIKYITPNDVNVKIINDLPERMKLTFIPVCK